MKRKQIVSLFLAVALLLALAAPVCAASPGLSNFKKQTEYTGFSDVSSSAWYAETVKTVCEHGMMKGKEDGTFSPSGDVSMAEAVALACRLHDIYNGGSGIFSQASPWWKNYVDYWHNYSGWYFTEESDSFWRQTASRKTFAWLLEDAIPDDAYSAINTISAGSISDITGDEDEASIYRLFNAGVVTGSNGKFYPYSAISRAEAATIIARIIVPSLRVQFSIAPPSSTSSSSSSSSSSDSSSGSTTNTTTPPATCDYIINTNTGKFHYTWCRYVSKMSEKNKWYYSGTHDSVVSMGYVPCKVCRP